ncbi:MAG: GHKL domain-containing protein [Coprobacillus sp.]
MIVYLVSLFSTLVINSVVVFLLCLKYQFKFDKKYIPIVIGGYTLIISMVNLLHIAMLNLIVNILVFYLIDYLCFEKRKLSKYFFDGFILVGCVLLDGMTHFLVEWFMIYFHISITFAENYVLKMLISMIVLVLFCMIVYRRYLNKDLTYISLKETWMYICVLVLSLVLATIIMTQIRTESFIYGFVSIVILFAINLIILKNYFLLNERYKMETLYLQRMNKIQEDETYYHDLKDKYEETRKLIHDFKKHLTVISMMNEAKGDVNSYIQETAKRLDATQVPFRCDNRTLDIVLNDKIHYARSKGIEVDVKVSLEVMGDTLNFIQDFDLVSIFANIMDNAIEAMDNSDQKTLYLYIYNVDEMIHIEEVNACSNQLITKSDQYISTKENHKGLGLSIIKNAVEKYQGIFTIQIEDNECHLFISIPLPDK